MGWGEAESKLALMRRRAERAEARAQAWERVAECWAEIYHLALDPDLTDDVLNAAMNQLNFHRDAAERLPVDPPEGN